MHHAWHAGEMRSAKGRGVGEHAGEAELVFIKTPGWRIAPCPARGAGRQPNRSTTATSSKNHHKDKDGWSFQ
jgi:hypothetical protein